MAERNASSCALKPGARSIEMAGSRLCGRVPTAVQGRPFSAKPCGFSVLQGLLCSHRMEPSRPSSFNAAGAGGLLLGTTGAGIGAGALIGWGAGSAAIGALAGAAVGIPAGIFVVYRRYRDAI